MTPRAADTRNVRAVLAGVLVGVVVFLVLLLAFSSGTGPAELVLNVAVAMLVGVVTTRYVRSRSTS